MKKSTFLILAFLVFTISNFAQTPQAVKYQAVVRDADENVLRNQAVGVQLVIRQSDPTGASVYTETFATSSNSYGLINLEIGTGTTGDDFSSIAWSNGPYFLETSIDVSGGTNYVLTGANEFLSVPYAFYSDTSAYAGSADYNSLLNKPVTITSEQAAKVDYLTVTSTTNLDDLSADVAVNNTKVSFPGFGTVPGKALEGNNYIWEKNNNDIFFSGGNVGIGVPTTSLFGGSRLHIGGGILYEGTPSAMTPGMLYYNSAGNGKFHYVDNTSNSYELGTGAITYNDTIWKNVSGNVYTTKPAIIMGGISMGNDAGINDVFGFNTIMLKENNLRILFDDTDDPLGSYPANDWQIEINESTNGGTNHFAIRDITGGTVPFKILGSAPNNALFVNSNGNVGIGTTTTSQKLTVNGIVKADTFIGDGSGLTGITGGTGGTSDPGDLNFGADSDNNNTGEIAFQTQNTTRMTISNAGNVGIGTTTPSTDLEVAGDAKFSNLTVGGHLAFGGLRYGITIENYLSGGNLDYDVTGKSIINITGFDQVLEGFTSGLTGQKVTIFNQTSNFKIKHNGTGTQKILLPESTDILLEVNESASFIFDGTSWYCISLIN